MCCKKIRHGLLIISLFFVIVSVSMVGCSLTNSQTTSASSTTITTTPNVPTITASNAYILVTQNLNNPTFIVIDVRTAGEFSSGHIVGAINIDYESPQFTAEVGQLDKDKIYLVYCATEIVARRPIQIMISQGFKNIQNIEDGITAWIQDGYPVIALTTAGTTTSQTTTTVLITTSTPPENGLKLQV